MLFVSPHMQLQRICQLYPIDDQSLEIESFNIFSLQRIRHAFNVTMINTHTSTQQCLFVTIEFIFRKLI